MKNLTFILMLIAATARAQFSNIDTTTVHAVPTWSSGSFINLKNVTGGTNDSYTTTNPSASYTGDTLATTQAKENYNWGVMAAWMATNNPYSSTNFWLNGVIDGAWGANDFSAQGATEIIAIVNGWANTNLAASGTVIATNAIPIFNGGGLQLSVTNTLTLVSTNISGWQLQSITFCGVTNVNLQCPFVWDAQIGAMTNCDGYVVLFSPPPTNLPFDIGSIWVTNGPYAGTYNPAAGAFTIFTNSYQVATTIYTNTGTSIVVTNAGSTGANQVYGSSGSHLWGAGGGWGISYQVGTLGTGFVPTYTIYSNSFQAYSIVYVNPVGTWSIVNGASPAPTSFVGAIIGTNYTSSYIWAIYQPSAWNFYSATNVSFAGNVVTVTGTSNSLFSVATVPQFPTATTAASDSLGNGEIFYLSSHETATNGYMPTLTNAFWPVLTNGVPMTNSFPPGWNPVFLQPNSPTNYTILPGTNGPTSWMTTNGYVTICVQQLINGLGQYAQSSIVTNKCQTIVTYTLGTGSVTNQNCPTCTPVPPRGQAD